MFSTNLPHIWAPIAKVDKLPQYEAAVCNGDTSRYTALETLNA